MPRKRKKTAGEVLGGAVQVGVDGCLMMPVYLAKEYIVKPIVNKYNELHAENNEFARRMEERREKDRVNRIGSRRRER